MAYSDITFKDKNPVKRWLQHRRLFDALLIAGERVNPKCILDFGAGNGELCKLIAIRFPKAKIVCYEPVSSLMDEAKHNLADYPQIHFCADVAEIADHSVDLLFCLEVFEHLPKAETEDAIGQFKRIMVGNGAAVIGVPIEIGIPALYKGVFRMSRRFGAFDASIKNVLSAAFGKPPKDRPVSVIAPGFTFHHDHMGFDYRIMENVLRARFRVQKTTSSPFSIFGFWLNPEAYFLVEKAHTSGGMVAER